MKKATYYLPDGKPPRILDVLKENADGTVNLGTAEREFVTGCPIGDAVGHCVIEGASNPVPKVVTTEGGGEAKPPAAKKAAKTAAKKAAKTSEEAPDSETSEEEEQEPEGDKTPAAAE